LIFAALVLGGYGTGVGLDFSEKKYVRVVL
jgi:hypothetical protein